MPSHCLKGGWILGHTVDGTQAEYVRIPLADSGLHHVPEGVNEKHLVMLSDILPTGLECGVQNGRVQPGQSVAVVGVGPVGLAAVMGSKLYSPSLIIAIDKDANRLKAAKKLGADHTVNPAEANPLDAVMGLTDNTGADTVIEAVGVPETLEMAQDLVAPGGTIANIGVHGKSCTLKIEKLWGHNISLTTRLVDTVTTPMLLRLFAAGSVPAGELITHGRFVLTELCSNLKHCRLPIPRNGKSIYHLQSCFGECCPEDADYHVLSDEGESIVVGGEIALQLLLTDISIIGSSDRPRCSSSCFSSCSDTFWLCLRLGWLAIDQDDRLVRIHASL
jgi:hypothetical protein